ncbi:sensor histidine kinase [Streptomyces tubercidicus]
MSDPYMSGIRVLSGLLFLGMAGAAWVTEPAAGGVIVAVGLLAAGAALATVARLPQRLAVRRCTGLVAATASVTVTACYRGPVSDVTGWWWVLETLALLALLVPTVRRTKGRGRAIVFASVQVTAIAVLPMRIGPYLDPPADPAETGVLCLICSLLAAGAAASGCYLRGLDSTRRRALAAQRRAQRLEVARDLHDFASHDVMGVVVLVQAARFLAREDPARAVELLPRIEEAGMQALAAMDRTVWTLNGDGDGDGDGEGDGGSGEGGGGRERALAAEAGEPGAVPAPPPGSPPGADRPGGPRHRRRDLSELPELVARFTRTGTVLARLDVTAGALDELPGEISATGYRIVVESLTNVRRHAPAAAAVDIAARRVPYGDGVALRLTVTDSDGAGTAARTPPLPEREWSGGGLAGLADRTEALGGSLAAGPHGTAGWQVAATLPLPCGAQPTAGRLGRTGLARHTAHEEAVT